MVGGVREWTEGKRVKKKSQRECRVGLKAPSNQNCESTRRCLLSLLPALLYFSSRGEGRGGAVAWVLVSFAGNMMGRGEWAGGLAS